MDTTQRPASDEADANTSPGSTPREHLQVLADEAGAALSDAKQQGAEQYEHLRDLATDQIDSLVDSAQSAASALEGKDTLGLSQYLGQLASGLGTFADQVRDKSAEELLHKGAQLARDNPAVFLAGSVAIGFALSRFLRASASAPSRPGSSLPAPSDLPQYQTSVPPLSADPAAASVPEPATQAAVSPPLSGTTLYSTPTPPREAL
nr:hypothetical protein [uncultured Pseudomonas sp.]